MNTLMVNEAVAFVKRFPTFFTLIRPFSTVNSLVLNEM